MPTTANMALPYPPLTNAPNVPADIQALAAQIESQFTFGAITLSLTGSTTNPTLGTGGSISALVRDVGHCIDIEGLVQFGTSGVAAGSGNYLLNFGTVNVGPAPLWTGQFFDASASTFYSYIGRLNTSTTMIFQRGDGTTAAWGAASPVVPAINDIFRFSGRLLGNS